MSSSSDTDDPLATLLASARRTVVREKRRLSDSAGDFTVDIPAIFHTVGQRNLELSRAHEQLQHDLRQKEHDTAQRNAAAQQQCQALVAELKNGGAGDEEARARKLLRECHTHPSLLERHLYVFDEPGGGSAAVAQRISLQTWGSAAQTEKLTVQVIEDALKSNDIKRLRQANSAVHAAVRRGVRSPERLDAAALLGELSLIEGQVSAQLLTVKLMHRNNNCLVNLLKTKLYLASHGVFETAADPQTLYRLFFMAVNDHNVTRFWYTEMLSEFAEVFAVLFHSFPIDAGSMAGLLRDTFRVKLFGAAEPFEWTKYDVSLVYNTILVLQLAFVQRPATNTAATRYVRELARAVVDKSVSDILRDALAYMAGDFSNIFEDFGQINRVYELDFHLKMIRFISDKPAPKHTKLLFRLKELYHARLGDISFLPCSFDKVIVKQQLVRLFGDDFEILNYLHQKHIKLESLDEDHLFYGADSVIS